MAASEEGIACLAQDSVEMRSCTRSRADLATIAKVLSLQVDISRRIRTDSLLFAATKKKAVAPPSQTYIFVEEDDGEGDGSNCK